MDGNADTCCAESNFCILKMTRRTVDVYLYNSTSYKLFHDIPIVSAVTAYDDPTTGLSSILVLYECLFYGKELNRSLLNPNQI